MANATPTAETRDEARRLRDDAVEAREQANRRREEAWAEVNNLARCTAICVAEGREADARHFAAEYTAATAAYHEAVAESDATRKAWLRAREEWLRATA